jgi:hypothetical protein
MTALFKEGAALGDDETVVIEGVFDPNGHTAGCCF